MKILGIEIETDFDYNDADDVEKFEKLSKKAGEKLKEIRKNQEKVSRADIIRNGCNIIFDFFDELIGEGTHNKIFGTKTNLTKCIKAFEDFIEEIINQDNNMFEEANNFVKKYSPNRATRRSKK